MAAIADTVAKEGEVLYACGRVSLKKTAAMINPALSQALPGILSPLILEEHDPILDSTWAIPDELLPEVELAAASAGAPPATA